MTDETKKLFNAPWEVCLEKRGSFYRPCVVSSDTKIASVCTKENANRLARLPELYDALLDKVADICLECHHESRRPFPGKDRLAEIGCPFKDEPCQTAKHLDILRKVRDGK